MKPARHKFGWNLWIAIGIVLALLALVRIMLPHLLLSKINKKLEHASESVAVHIDDMDLVLIAGRYDFDDIQISARRAPTAPPFARVGSLKIGVAWSELIHGRILADVEIEKLMLRLGDELAAARDTGDATAKTADLRAIVDTLIPFNVARIEIEDSSVLHDLPGTKDVHELVTGLEGRFSHIANREGANVLPSLAALKGRAFGGGAFTMTGEVLPFATPILFNFDFKLEGFDLPKANPYLKEAVPLTFTSGKMNLYSEFKFEDGAMRGYVKPFLREVDVIRTHEKFRGTGHFLAEVGTALANTLFQNRGDSKSSAAIVEFTSAGNKTTVNSFKALSSAVGHGLIDDLPEGFDNTVALNALADPAPSPRAPANGGETK